jgi:hypothetical protein
MGKKIAYNVSTINYLWQAENLAQSFLKHNPDYDFYVCVIDKPNPDFQPQDYNFSFHIIWIDDLQIHDWEKMLEHYLTFELVIATKAMVLDYLFTTYQPDFALCLDSDILIFDNFSAVEEQFKETNIILTPHCYLPMPYITPIDKVIHGFSDKIPFEDRLFLHVGIYNIGFIGVKNNAETQPFREWWIKMSKNQCFVGRKQGMFGEQLCLNLVPLYFEKVALLKHLGYNVAGWNLHERKISQKNGKFYVNDTIPLAFFHYSGYEYKNPHKITKWVPLTLDERPDVKPLFDLYHQTYLETKWDKLKAIPCAFVKMKEEIMADKKVVWKEPLQYKIIRRLINTLPLSIQKDIKHILQ